MFLYYPDMPRPSLNPIEQYLHLKHHAKWTSKGSTIGVKVNGLYIEVLEMRPRIPRFVQTMITCWHDDFFEIRFFCMTYLVLYIWPQLTTPKLGELRPQLLPINWLRFQYYPTDHSVNCGIGSKTESIAWVEAENKAPPIWRWGNESVVAIFTRVLKF